MSIMILHDRKLYADKIGVRYSGGVMTIVEKKKIYVHPLAIGALTAIGSYHDDDELMAKQIEAIFAFTKIEAVLKKFYKRPFFFTAELLNKCGPVKHLTAFYAFKDGYYSYLDSEHSHQGIAHPVLKAYIENDVDRKYPLMSQGCCDRLAGTLYALGVPIEEIIPTCSLYEKLVSSDFDTFNTRSLVDNNELDLFLSKDFLLELIESSLNVFRSYQPPEFITTTSGERKPWTKSPNDTRDYSDGVSPEHDDAPFQMLNADKLCTAVVYYGALLFFGKVKDNELYLDLKKVKDLGNDVVDYLVSVTEPDDTFRLIRTQKLMPTMLPKIFKFEGKPTAVKALKCIRDTFFNANQLAQTELIANAEVIDHLEN